MSLKPCRLFSTGLIEPMPYPDELGAKEDESRRDHDKRLGGQCQEGNAAQQHRATNARDGVPLKFLDAECRGYFKRVWDKSLYIVHGAPSFLLACGLAMG